MDRHDVSVTSLNILDGLSHQKHWDTLQPAWEEEGMGFIEFCLWITEIAILANEKLEARDPQSFPGVFDYEVSCEVGEQVLMHVTSTGRLPSTEELSHWLDVQMDTFFAQA